MAIPKEILEIERPVNTVVKASRTPDVYSVVKRTSKRIPGKKNPQPIELGVIGKIAHGRYIPNPEKPIYEVDFKIYGPTALCHKVGQSIYDDLLRFYQIEDARKIYCIAILRAIEPEITNDEIEVEYKTSFLSEIFPKVSLSANTISSFLDETGKHLCIINDFMNDRIRQYSGNPTVIDGMLKSNISFTNTMSEFSRKGRIKNTEDISCIYAYDLVVHEPVAFSVYPGNMLDFTSFRSFLDEHPIENGFLIMDKGFDDFLSKEEIKKLDTKYLIPIKNSSKLIKEYNLDKSYTNSFKYEEDSIRCKCIAVSENKYLYAFKSSEMKACQDKIYVENNIEKGSFKEATYEKKESYFGLIVFESNAKLDLKDVYRAYQERWNIEVLFNNYTIRI